MPEQRATAALQRGCLLLLSLLALTACEPGASLKPLSPDAVVLAFGNSLTHGTGAPAGAAYPDQLATLLGRTVINAGVPGEIASEGRARLPALLAEHRPALVILMHGGNDFLRRANPSEVEPQIRAMINMTRDAGADVVLMGVPRPGLFLKPPDLYRDLAEEFRLPYDAEALPALLGDRARKSDAVHLNADGYRKLAEAIHRLIDEASDPVRP